MAAYVQHGDSFFSRRTTVFLLIVGLHAVLIYGFATGFARTVIAVIAQPIQATFTPEPRTREPPPPLPQPNFSAQQIKIPTPEFPLDVPLDPGTIDVVTTQGVDNNFPPPTPPTNVVNRVLGGPGKAFPSTEDYYPAESIRRREQGTATVRTCVDDTGRLTAAPTLAQSSGSASIDAGALRLAKAGSGHYRATTEDGRPVSSCYEFRIKYHLKD
jgi:TonB family protein